MKVLFFNYEFPPLGGGAATATFCIMQEFSKVDGIEVDVVTSSVDENYHLEKIGKNIRLHRLPIGKNKSNLHYQSQKDLLIYAWKAYWFSKKLIKKNKYNLTHSFFTVPCGFISMMLKWQFKIPYIVSLRGSDVPGYSDRFSFIYNFLKPIIVLIWKCSSVVISNSKDLKALALKSNSEQEVGVIYNGVDIDQFKPDNGRKSANKFIVTPGASRITARKGLNYLVEAVSKIVADHPNVCLKIMGEGNEEESLKNLVKELKLQSNVEFLGRIEHDEVLKYYQEANIFTLPSLNEGMSNAMLEALSTGLPLIATNTGGADELIRDGENGFIVRMKDSDDIAEKITLIIKDKELENKMSKKSREIAEGMSWKKVSEQYLELYNKVK